MNTSTAILLVLCSFTAPISLYCQKQFIQKSGMSLEWSFGQEQVLFTLSAPTQGWVALGINTDPALVGSNLIMGCYSEHHPQLSDRYVTAMGHHAEVTSIGGRPHIEMLAITESEEMTSLAFSIKKKAADPLHFDLTQGLTYYFTLAYSEEDEFSHHSIMRTMVKQRL